jgi:hypothetical protein
MKEKTKERYKDIKKQRKKSARSYGKVFIRSYHCKTVWYFKGQGVQRE